VQHGGEGAGSRVDGVPRLVVLLRSGVLAKVLGSNGAGVARLARASTPGLGWYFVHAEGSGATSQARGQVTDTRGSHNDATLAS
jgi:hypothetical protein